MYVMKAPFRTLAGTGEDLGRVEGSKGRILVILKKRLERTRDHGKTREREHDHWKLKVEK